MANNTLLTIDKITRPALKILHEKLTFTRSINRGYDSQYAQAGAKIGDTLRIRLPNEYIVGSGPNITPQDTVNQYQTLKIDAQDHVAIEFGGAEMTLSLDDYATNVLEPAMSVLAAKIEARNIMRATLVTPWQVGTPGTVPATLETYLNARTVLRQALAPKDNNINMLISSRYSAKIVDALKTLSEDSGQIGKQYREGYMSRTAGFDWAESESMHTHQNGSGTVACQVDANVTVDGTDQLALKGLGNGNTVTAGTVLSIAGRFDVHPETKAVRTTVKQFVVQETVTADGTGDAVVTVLPKIFFGNTGRRNIASAPLNNDNVTIAGTASVGYECGLAYHKNAFTFATADLPLPAGADGSRQQFDGISMRIWRDSDVMTDNHICRVDVLSGFAGLRYQHAARVAG